MLGIDQDHYADQARTYNYLALLLAIDTGVDPEYALSIGGLQVDTSNPAVKYSAATVDHMTDLKANGYSLSNLGRLYQMRPSSIWDLLHRRRIHENGTDI